MAYNGTFCNNFAALPQFGYNSQRPLQDKNDRRTYKLADLPRMPKIDDRSEYANNDLVGGAGGRPTCRVRPCCRNPWRSTRH